MQLSAGKKFNTIKASITSNQLQSKEVKLLISVLFTHINSASGSIGFVCRRNIVWWHPMIASAVCKIIYRAGGVILTCFLDLSDALP